MKLKKKFIERCERICTGIPELDNQHHDLFDSIKKFDAPLLTQDDIFDLLTVIESSLKVHLETEELYMTEFFYPKIKQHMEEHRIVLQKCEEAKKTLLEKGICLYFVADFQNFLIIWLNKHYSRADIELANFIKNQFKVA
jgi:hemerythrin-like metal-binding protein